MNRVLQINTAKLHTLLEAIAKRSYDEGYEHGLKKKDRDYDRVKIDIRQIWKLDEKRKTR
jgi:hypothetical protein